MIGTGRGFLWSWSGICGSRYFFSDGDGLFWGICWVV